jgi:hypothetical protein
MEFDAKLEAALKAEIKTAEKLRLQIHETLQDIYSLADSAPYMDFTRILESEYEVKGPQSDTSSLNNDTSYGGDDNFDDMEDFEQDPRVKDNGVKVNCFPSKSHVIAAKGVVTQPMPVSASKLAYMNHAELLKKYGSI